MKNSSSFLSKINHDPKSNLYLLTLDNEYVKESKNKIDI
jgi:histidinol dehydrogenase